MAGLPEPANESSLESVKDRISDLLADGLKPNEIARRLGGGDPKRTKLWRGRIRNWAYGDLAFQQKVALKNQGELILGLGTTTQALLKRAHRGRTDAVKLVYEASGFHNPRVQHEHSGEVNITMTNVPRPTGEVGQSGNTEEPVDAEVVEES